MTQRKYLGRFASGEEALEAMGLGGGEHAEKMGFGDAYKEMVRERVKADLNAGKEGRKND